MPPVNQPNANRRTAKDIDCERRVINFRRYRENRDNLQKHADALLDRIKNENEKMQRELNELKKWNYDFPEGEAEMNKLVAE